MIEEPITHLLVSDKPVTNNYWGTTACNKTQKPGIWPELEYEKLRYMQNSKEILLSKFKRINCSECQKTDAYKKAKEYLFSLLLLELELLE